jgi:exoribonuclease R
VFLKIEKKNHNIWLKMGRSYQTNELIVSDSVVIRRGEHMHTKGHVVKIDEHTVDILVGLKKSDNVIITVLTKDVLLRQRMFFRTKDIRKSKYEQILQDFQKLNIKTDEEIVMERLVKIKF